MMPADPPSWPRRAGRWLPFLLPPLALAFVVWLQPPDHMGPGPDRAGWEWVGRLAYDDWDWSAVVLRGLNASLGRKAGADDEGDVIEDDEALTAAMNDPDGALAGRYYLEYPHAATWLFRLPFHVHPVHAPPALCDGSYGNVIFHRPQDEQERATWRSFRLFAQTYAAVMVACLLLLMLLVRLGYEPGGGLSGPAWLLVLPGALYFTLSRFDALPAVLTAASLFCLGRRRLLPSAVFLAAATMVKVYPVLLAPFIFRFLWDDRRAALRWAAAYAGAAGLILLPSLLETDWPSVLGPYHAQLVRRPLGPTAYGNLLPESLAANDATGRGFRFGTLALLMLALFAPRPPDLASVLRRGAVAVIVFANLSVFYSPQWVLWFAPMLVPLAGRSRPLLVLVAALDLVTYLTFPVVMDYSYENWPLGEGRVAALKAAWPALMGAVIYARFAVLAAIIALLLWAEVRRPQAGPVPALKVAV